MIQPYQAHIEHARKLLLDAYDDRAKALPHLYEVIVEITMAIRELERPETEK